MSRDNTLLWVLGSAAVAALLYTQAGSIGDAVTAAVSGWPNVNTGPVWVPVINQTEDALGIPTNLLARQAYQESHFRPEIISGTLKSPAGALGILQLMPQFFSSVRVPVPFTTGDVQAQITEAGNEMVRLYNHYQDWGLALAAYNWGEGNVDKWLAAGGSAAFPAETQNYVSQILADVPVSTGVNV